MYTISLRPGAFVSVVSMSQAEVERLVAEHAAIVASGAQRENHAMFLWQLVNLEMWLREVDAVGRDAPVVDHPGACFPAPG